MTELSWSEFKYVLDNNDHSLQMTDLTNQYLLYAVSHPFEFRCVLEKGTDDAEDFEDNYLASANTESVKPLTAEELYATPVDIKDISDAGGVQGAVTVTSSAVEAKVDSSPLAYRKNLTVYNNGSDIIYWGYTSGVTTSSGTPLEKKSLTSWNVGPNTSIYLIAASGSHNVRVTESA